MEKTIHTSVTEYKAATPALRRASSSLYSSENENDNEKMATGLAPEVIIEEVAVDPPAQDPANSSYAIRRTSKVHRHRREKPLPLDRAASVFHRVPRAIKGLLIIIFTGVPFMVFMLVARYALRSHNIGPVELHATYFKLAKWMTVCWASLLIISSLAEILALFASWICSQSKHWVKYAPLANTLCLRLSMLVWAAVAYAWSGRVWTSAYRGKNNWPATLKQVFIFLTVSFAVLLVQGIVLQLIAIRYVEGYVGPRARKGLAEIETIRDLNALVKRHMDHDDPSYLVKILKRIFYPVEDLAFDAIVNGTADEEAHREYAATIWNTVTIDMRKEALTLQDISSRLKAMRRDPEAGENLFAQLDKSGDGKVTRDELEELVISTGAQLNKRADSMKGIKKLLFKLELLLTCLVFGAIVFIYSNFFNQNWVKDSKALWTGVTGLGFALNTTIAEFVASCVFVFAKHAYDVGDLVEAKSKKLLVRDIHLTHTNFQEIREGDAADATGMVVQISHATLAGEVIVNWTRSNDLKIAQKEKDQCCNEPDEGRRPSVAKFAGW